MEQENFAEAQIVMQFTKDHFADVVLPKEAAIEQPKEDSRKARREQENLRLLDRLVLT